MRIIRNIALAAAAAGALALAAAASAQDSAKPDTQAKKEQRGEHSRHGMGGMREMRGGCHGEPRGAAERHEHS